MVKSIKVIDLFHGVGGFRVGFEIFNSIRSIQSSIHSLSYGLAKQLEKWEPLVNRDIQFVWGNDNDKFASRVYRQHYKEVDEETERELFSTKDIRRVLDEEIPRADIVCGGFPCQPYSVAGKRKGLEDPRGELFYEILRVADVSKPSWLLLENVEGLLNHDEGATFQKILESLEAMGYISEWQVLDSRYFFVPQGRRRVFLACHRRGGGRGPILPIFESPTLHLTEAHKEQRGGAPIWSKVLSTITRNYGRVSNTGEPYILENPGELDVLKWTARRFTPLECERIQGFPDNWTLNGVRRDGRRVTMSVTRRWALMGNSVAVPVISDLAARILKTF